MESLQSRLRLAFAQKEKLRRLIKEWDELQENLQSQSPALNTTVTCGETIPKSKISASSRMVVAMECH